MSFASLTSSLLAAVLLVACQKPQNLGWRVGLRSYGPVHFGITLDEASALLGERLQADTTNSGACTYVFAKATPHVAFMVIEGRIQRVDIDSAGVETISGAHVGVSEDEVRALYPGRIRTQPHQYTGPEGHYLIYVPRDAADAGFGLIFETNGRVVLNFRAGLQPAVGYVEGCS